MRGGLVKRGETWTATLYLGPDPQTGKKRYRWIKLKATTKNEAQTELSALVAKHTEGRLPAAPAKLTVKEFLDRWLAHAKGQVRPLSYEKYEEIVRTRLVPHLGDLKLTKLSPLAIQDCYTKLLASGGRKGRPLSRRSVEFAHATLHRALVMAVKWQLLAVNPADAVEPPRPLKAEARLKAAAGTLDEAATTRLLAAARGTVWYVPLLLAVASGARRAEVLGLRWTDVDLDRGRLSIGRALISLRSGEVRAVPTKSGKPRAVALPAAAVAALRTHKAEQAKLKFQAGRAAWRDDLDLVLPYPGTPGELWSPESFTSGFRAWCRRNGFAGLKFHALRHGHASHLLRSGASLKSVSSRLGHSTVSITGDLYAHLLGGEDEALAASIDAVLDAGRVK